MSMPSSATTWPPLEMACRLPTVMQGDPCFGLDPMCTCLEDPTNPMLCSATAAGESGTCGKLCCRLITRLGHVAGHKHVRKRMCQLLGHRIGFVCNAVHASVLRTTDAMHGD